MKTTTRLLDLTAAMVLVVYVSFSPPLVSGEPGRRVSMTLVRDAAALGACMSHTPFFSWFIELYYFLDILFSDKTFS